MLCWQLCLCDGVDHHDYRQVHPPARGIICLLTSQRGCKGCMLLCSLQRYVAGWLYQYVCEQIEPNVRILCL